MRRCWRTLPVSSWTATSAPRPGSRWVTCHLSPFTCHLSSVTCHLLKDQAASDPLVTCNISLKAKFNPPSPGGGQQDPESGGSPTYPDSPPQEVSHLTIMFALIPTLHLPVSPPLTYPSSLTLHRTYPSSSHQQTYSYTATQGNPNHDLRFLLGR